MLDALADRRVLLLQGPAGPFFRRLAGQLRERGASVTKVNFSAGDDLFFSGPEVVRYQGPGSEWPEFFVDLVQRERIDAIVLFGDCRPYHLAATARAKHLGLDVFVFEEGYLRPDFVTLEKGGVNGYSSIPRDPDFYRGLSPSSLPEPRPVGNTFRRAAGYAIAYSVTHGLLGRRYPHYRHHRNIQPLHQAACWVRGGMRKLSHAWRDRAVDEQIASQALNPFYLVPLQVHFDMQMKHCRFGSVDEFIEETVCSFAAHAPEGTRLVVKDHPMGRPYRNYTALLDELRQQHRLEGRLMYVDAIHLPSALRAAVGTVVINSTVGLSSIHHDTPVKCLGSAVYDMPGLTFQGPLDAFWTEPGEIDADLYRRFRWWLRRENQLNGSVWTELYL